ncbi:hypothetical protein [Bacillus wiedmannii]|uniref:hypothetical protein n=1 Tax=Bacillus wiedmannii TaxID=1890302 RepID=UPI00142EBDB8|nr:hypothetical protein [Bacillus wiedmannii]
MNDQMKKTIISKLRTGKALVPVERTELINLLKGKEKKEKEVTRKWGASKITRYNSEEN